MGGREAAAGWEHHSPGREKVYPQHAPSSQASTGAEELELTE